MIRNYKNTDATKLSAHFNSKEFKCKCGKPHDFKLSDKLVDKLEQLYSTLNCTKIIVNSGYRCTSHDKSVGGTGHGQHTIGTAADIVCYGSDGNIISSKIVTCAAQDIGFPGIANINKKYTAVHVDVRDSNTYRRGLSRPSWACELKFEKTSSKYDVWLQSRPSWAFELLFSFRQAFGMSKKPHFIAISR